MRGPTSSVITSSASPLARRRLRRHPPYGTSSIVMGSGLMRGAYHIQPRPVEDAGFTHLAFVFARRLEQDVEVTRGARTAVNGQRVGADDQEAHAVRGQ